MDYDYLKYKKILIVDDEADLREIDVTISRRSASSSTMRLICVKW